MVEGAGGSPTPWVIGYVTDLAASSEACPLHRPLSAALGVRSPSRRYAGEVLRLCANAPKSRQSRIDGMLARPAPMKNQA